MDYDGDEDFAGYVTPRVRNADVTSIGSNPSSQRTQGGSSSWARDGDDTRQARREDVSSTRSPMSTPSRPRGRTKNPRRTPPRPPQNNTSRTAWSSTTPDEFSLPPELPPENQSSFKTWLTAGLLDSFNIVAGVTLSTTGQLMAPPLHVTRAVLLPALLALFIDTLDNITPTRVQNWFRVLSSSVYHLFSVLRSTEHGQSFSQQLVVFLKDVIQAFSAPESRQVIVDFMATNVKLAEALNTPETKALLEQLATLGCRLVDAAAGGKTKQVLQDGKELAWKGIEMVSDPASTLALAEVTAHLCRVLEETEDYMASPTPRAMRNAQNQSTYMNPYTMSSGYPKQATTEEVILSCLGLLNDNDDEERDDGENEDSRSIPSNVLLSLDTGVPPSDHPNNNASDTDGFKERGETVNVQLLREKILFNNRQPTRGGGGVSSALSSAKSSVDSRENVSPDPLLGPPLNTRKDIDEMPVEKVTADYNNQDDLEDIRHDFTPTLQVEDDGALNSRLNTQQIKSTIQGTPAVVEFYSALDDLLNQQQRLKSFTPRQPQQTNTEEDNDPKSILLRRQLFDAKVKKWKDGHLALVKEAKEVDKKATLKFKNLTREQKIIVLSVALFIGSCFLVFSGFAVYGMYSLRQNYRGSPAVPLPITNPVVTSAQQVTTNAPPQHGTINGSPTEIVIRVVKEVVHVREDGSTVDDVDSASSTYDTVSDDEIQKVAECVQSSLLA